MKVRRDRPSVADEVANSVWYLEQRLLQASDWLDFTVKNTFKQVFSEELGQSVKIPVGSWVGGDRDGNPFVTPETTFYAIRRSTSTLMAHYQKRIEELMARLSISDRQAKAPDALRESIQRDRELLYEVWETNVRRDSEEPIRLKLSFMVARLEATRHELAALEQGRKEQRRGSYQKNQELVSDLELIRDALEHVGADYARASLLQPLLDQVRFLGFAGYRLDVRGGLRGAHERRQHDHPGAWHRRARSRCHATGAGGPEAAGESEPAAPRRHRKGAAGLSYHAQSSGPVR